MPYSILKNKDGSYRVINAITGKVHAKRTTLEHAHAQIRIMQAQDYLKKIIPKNKSK